VIYCVREFFAAHPREIRTLTGSARAAQRVCARMLAIVLHFGAAMRTVIPARAILFAALIVIAGTIALRAAPQNPAKPGTMTLAAASVLQTFLPNPDGWTRVREVANRVGLSDDCAYAIATAQYNKGEAGITITIADSGMNPDSLQVLAPMIGMLPENHEGTIKPGTTVRRFKMTEHQAAERWDARAFEGEVVILVGGRFVVSAEGFHLDAVATLYKVLEPIDLTKVAALK
jgi:hypothetical protein